MNAPLRLGWFLLPLLVGGCASVSVTREQRAPPYAVVEKPEAIYVEAFATGLGEFNVDRTGPELARFKKDLATVMQEYLSTLIEKHLGVPARTVAAYPKRDKGWLVVGHFVRVNQGSRALRMIVGFGAGGTKMETSVAVYDLSATPDRRILQFETTGGSGAEPGAIAGGGLAEVAVSAASGVGKGVSEDCARTAKMITATLSDYMVDKGWLSGDQALTPKRKN